MARYFFRRELCVHVRESQQKLKKKRQRNMYLVQRKRPQVELLLRKTARIAIKSIKEALLVTRQSFG